MEIDLAKAASFGGRVDKVDVKNSLIRFKFGFENRKYITKNDRVEFFNKENSPVYCGGTVIAKTEDIFLVRVSDMSRCMAMANITPGAYLRFYSRDMETNLKLGRELVQILLKKKVAVAGMLIRAQKELDVNMEKVNAINSRYDVLRKKLELEWQEQLGVLEEDRLASLEKHRKMQRKLDEVNLKLEQYKIDEDNFFLHTWSLNPKLYYKK